MALRAKYRKPTEEENMVSELMNKKKQKEPQSEEFKATSRAMGIAEQDISKYSERKTREYDSMKAAQMRGNKKKKKSEKGKK